MMQPCAWSMQGAASSTSLCVKGSRAQLWCSPAFCCARRSVKQGGALSTGLWRYKWSWKMNWALQYVLLSVWKEWPIQITLLQAKDVPHYFPTTNLCFPLLIASGAHCTVHFIFHNHHLHHTPVLDAPRISQQQGCFVVAHGCPLQQNPQPNRAQRSWCCDLVLVSKSSPITWHQIHLRSKTHASVHVLTWKDIKATHNSQTHATYTHIPPPLHTHTHTLHPGSTLSPLLERSSGQMARSWPSYPPEPR